MSSPKIEFAKEKTLMPDGRYLLYYNFDPIPQSLTSAPANSSRINETKEEANV